MRAYSSCWPPEAALLDGMVQPGHRLRRSGRRFRRHGSPEATGGSRPGEGRRVSEGADSAKRLARPPPDPRAAAAYDRSVTVTSSASLAVGIRTPQLDI